MSSSSSIFSKFYVKKLIFSEIHRCLENFHCWFRALSLNPYACYYRSFQYRNKVLPVYLIYCNIVFALYFHELVALYEGLLMKIAGIALIVYHTNLAVVFRYEYVNVSIQRIAVVSTADYIAYTLSLASHVVKFRKIIEVMQSVYT